MIKDITKENKIFESPDYQKDILSFSVMEIIKDNFILLKSDEENFIIGRNDLERPIVIWTKDNITKEKYLELLEFIKKNYNGDVVHLFSKKEMMDKFFVDYLRKYYSVEIKLDMVSYENKNIIVPKNNYIVSYADKLDINQIVNIVCLFNQEASGEETNVVKTKEKMLNFIEKKWVVLIKENQKIISMASIIRDTGNYMSIGYVYTNKEYRNRKLAATIVAILCNDIEKNNKVPLLYADYDNPISNKAYQNIGFSKVGVVEEIKLRKK